MWRLFDCSLIVVSSGGWFRLRGFSNTNRGQQGRGLFYAQNQNCLKRRERLCVAFFFAGWIRYHPTTRFRHWTWLESLVLCVGRASLGATTYPGAALRSNAARRWSVGFGRVSGRVSVFFQAQLRLFYLHTSHPQVSHRHTTLSCYAFTEICACGKPVDVCAQLKNPRFAVHTLVGRPGRLRCSLLCLKKNPFEVATHTLVGRPGRLRCS